jgi:2-aminobenzoate-CoA ligase
VEAALNSVEFVRASRVFARKSSVTGSLVCADVVLRDGSVACAETELAILSACRARLLPHSIPAALRFVVDLPVTPGGKLARHG